MFAAWGPGADNPWFTIPRLATARHLGPLPPADPLAPGPMAFADADRVLGLLGAAGWHDARAEDVNLDLTPLGTPQDVAAMLFTLGPSADMAGEQAASAEDAARTSAAIKAGIASGFAPFQGPNGIRVPARVRYFSARRPG
ncbi:MAG: hypothetical protein H6901_10805 [Rhodobacteraceae bacterium]|nr:hypothetical protein [Paracoccaceae bacterium]MCP5342694.1 hypothetical protein [Paracoccaceae bacterium]